MIKAISFNKEACDFSHARLHICETFYKTKKEAHDAMIKGIMQVTDYKTLEEIIDSANAGNAGFSDDDAWAETKQSEIGQWKIVQVQV